MKKYYTNILLALLIITAIVFVITLAIKLLSKPKKYIEPFTQKY